MISKTQPHIFVQNWETKLKLVKSNDQKIIILLSDKQDLARDYRLDRLNKTDKGMFFRNRFMRKR